MSHRSPTFPLKKRFPCQVESIKRHDVSSNVCRRFQPYGLHRRKIGKGGCRPTLERRRKHRARLSSCRSRKHVASAVAGRILTYIRTYARLYFLFYFREPASALQTDYKGKINGKVSLSDSSDFARLRASRSSSVDFE